MDAVMRIGSLVGLALCVVTVAHAQQIQPSSTYYPAARPPLMDPFAPPVFPPPPLPPPPMMPYPAPMPVPMMQPMPFAQPVPAAFQTPAPVRAPSSAQVPAPAMPTMPAMQPAPQMVPATTVSAVPVAVPQATTVSPSGRPLVVGAAEVQQPGDGLSIRKTRIGSVLADAKGRTLYTPAADAGEECKNCALWQPVLVDNGGAVPSPLQAMHRKDGASQWSYAGHLLYRWAGDESAGDVTGDGVDGNWFAVRVSQR